MSLSTSPYSLEEQRLLLLPWRVERISIDTVTLALSSLLKNKKLKGIVCAVLSRNPGALRL
jgi:hypothetical protein